MKKSRPTITNVFGHVVEMNKSHQEANRQLQLEIRGLVEMNKTQLEGNCQLQEQIRGLVEMNKSQQDGNRQLQEQICGLVEINKSQHDGYHHLQEQICGLVKMNKNQQEGFNLLQQQVYEIQGTILKTLLHPQPEMRHQVTGEEVPGLSTGPLENSIVSDNYRRREEYAEYVKTEMEDNYTDDEETSNGGVTSNYEWHMLPSQTTKKTLTPKSSDNWMKFKQDSLSAIIDKLWMKEKLPVICKETKGVFFKDEIASKGEASIFSKGVWLFPGEFEFLSGSENSKNWKKSIYINMKKLKKYLKMSDAELSKFRKITLNDLFKQRAVKPPCQKMRYAYIEYFKTLFQE